MPVTLTTPGGQQVQAVKKNEISSRCRSWTRSERIRGYVKSDLKEVKDETKSAMPRSAPTASTRASSTTSSDT
jgi:hypothetical protein